MAKLRLSPEQTERFVALQSALRQHFFAPSLNKLELHLKLSKKTLSRYADVGEIGYAATPSTLDNICDNLINFYEMSDEMFRTLPQQFGIAQMLYDAWQSQATRSLTSVCEWVTLLSSGTVPPNFPKEQREDLENLLQARTSAFSWLSLVLAHFFIKAVGNFEGKENEIPQLIQALEALDTHLSNHYPRRYGRNIYPILADRLPNQSDELLSRCYYVQLAELMIGEYSNPNAEHNPRMGSHLRLGPVSCWHRVGETPENGRSLWIIREPTRSPEGILTPKYYTITEFVLNGSALHPYRHARISFRASNRRLICTQFGRDEIFEFSTYSYSLNDTDTQFHFTPCSEKAEGYLPETLDRVNAAHDDAGELWQRLIDKKGENQLAREAFEFEMSMADLFPVDENEMQVIDVTRTRQAMIVSICFEGTTRDIAFDNVQNGLLKNVLPNDAIEIFYDRFVELYVFYWPAHDEMAIFDPNKTYEELISDL